MTKVLTLRFNAGRTALDVEQDDGTFKTYIGSMQDNGDWLSEPGDDADDWIRIHAAMIEGW